MVNVLLVVPVMKNFAGAVKLMNSVGPTVVPFIYNNWDENFGVSRAWNEGLLAAMKYDFDYAFICNDDITVDEGSLEKLVFMAPEYDVITMSNRRDAVNKAGNTPDYSAFMVNARDFTKKFGYFDDGFFPAYFEDNDMEYRIRLAGGLSGNLPDATMYHQGSVTQNMDGPVVDSPQFEKNRAYYVAKWGGTPGNEQYTTPFGAE